MEYPLVSFCIITYNQEDYIREAILGAVNQDYPNMEIIISDDNSTDGTFDVINKTVNELRDTCSHIIKINRNMPNLGIREHCNKVLYKLAKGEIILLAGGDDISLPERTFESVKYFMTYPKVQSLSFSSKQVDINLNPIKTALQDITPEDFSILTLEDFIRFRDFIIFSGDSRALRREVIEKFPPLEFSKAEDIYFFVRSLILGSIVYVRKPLVLRRIHGNNASLSKSSKSLIINMKKQFGHDVKYAYDNKYISEYVFQALNDKVCHIIKREKKDYLISHHPFLYNVYLRIKRIMK